MTDPTEPENKTKALARVETSVCGLVLHTLEDMKTVAQLILQSNLAPESFDTAEKIFVGLQTGAEIGLKPMQSLNSIVVIKGKPTLWGDAALALVKRSGLLLDFTEKVTGEGDDMVAFVKSVRDEGGDKGRECIVETTFTVADAKTARLWGKAGPWTTHPQRMLKYKARAFNLRDNFPDVLYGMHVAEEMIGEEPLPAPESDVKPRGERRSLAAPSSDLDTTRAPVQEAEATSEPSALEKSLAAESTFAAENAKNNFLISPTESEPAGLVTFKCNKCDRTYRYGKEEGKGVQCECREGVLVEAEAEPSIEEKGDVAALYVEVSGMYAAQNGQDFTEFASYVLCFDEDEVDQPSKFTEEQLKQIKAYIETNGVAIN